MNHITVDTVVVGAGHAGLAVSRLLTEARRDHVVLDRGRIGERWRTQRWDSLHLLTPSWMTRLPHWQYAGPDPEGFMSANAFVGQLERYAESFAAPVVGGTTVLSVRRCGLDQYAVVTDRATYAARQVVVATGPHGTPVVPRSIGHTDLDVVHSSAYRNPGQLPTGGVLVVGASSSGVQIADELVRSGRDVVVAVGRHTRMPRRYRGMDIFWWLENTGRTARTIDEVRDAAAARREQSLQLVGRPATQAAETLDLAVLRARGARLAGRLESLTGNTAVFADDLSETVAASDRMMHRFLDDVDGYVLRAGLESEVLAAYRPRPLTDPTGPRRLHLAGEGIRTVVVATGFRPEHSWLHVPVLGPDGAIRQYRGVTEAPGLYVVGQRFQHRRDSGFIDGARHDAYAVVHHLLTGALPPLAAPVDRSASRTDPLDGRGAA
jgi:putative flavoprotein involved in K+ transport